MDSLQIGRPADAAEGMRVDVPQRLNLTEFILAARREDTRACFVTPDATIGYRDFDRLVRRIASMLAGRGVSAGSRVAFSLDDSIELAALFYGTIAVGAVPLVLNPHLEAETLAHILIDSEATVLFATPGKRAVIESAAGSLAAPPAVTYVAAGDVTAGTGGWLPADADPAWDAFHRQDREDLVLLQYTSGTTGRPKGVMHSARSALGSCFAFAEEQLDLTADDVFYSAPKTFFGYGMGNSLFFPLFLGAAAVLDPRWPTVDTVTENIARLRPTALFAVPTLYRKLLERDELWPADSPVRLAFSAGSPLSDDLRRDWRGRFGIDLYDGIGATELFHVFATTYPSSTAPGSLGRMVSGFRHRILGRDGAPVEPGEPGTLFVAGPSVALGYLGREETTREKFADGWYRTGDLFSVDADGNLFFHGREDDTFKVFGRWLVPLEIETLIKDRFDGVDEAFVVPGHDGYGEDRPVLFLVTSERDFEGLAESVRTAIGAALESYKVPALILPLDTPPTNENGKVRRSALAEIANARLQEARGPRTVAAGGRR